MITKWSELPMGKFLEIQAIDDTDELQIALKINAILNDMTVDELLASPLADVTKMSKAREFLAKRPLTRITRKRYRLGETVYTFDADPFKVLTSQFIDFESLDRKDVVGALAIFLIPEGHKYNDGYDLEKVKADIRQHLSAEDGLSITSFFTILLGLLYRRAIRKARRALKKARKAGVPTETAEKAIQELRQDRRFLRG